MLGIWAPIGETMFMFPIMVNQFTLVGVMIQRYIFIKWPVRASQVNTQIVYSDKLTYISIVVDSQNDNIMAEYNVHCQHHRANTIFSSCFDGMFQCMHIKFLRLSYIVLHILQNVTQVVVQYRFGPPPERLYVFVNIDLMLLYWTVIAIFSLTVGITMIILTVVTFHQIVKKSTVIYYTSYVHIINKRFCYTITTKI